MKFDPELLFECLIFINAHYYPVFAVSEMSMLVAKYLSDKKDTPNLDQDAVVCLTRHVCELMKLVLFQRFKYSHKKFITFFSLFLTLLTCGTIYYNMQVQQPVLRLEIVLSCLTTLMIGSELICGVWFLLPCYKKVEYF
ncbi:uncharacterized protein LOC130892244 [Diorhabda carinulata]|uniref:uncharacterized protein LOC130445514 n=1 Tax=Diorhabda sublineata TaxID=1163346 RepID=UPI0024E04D7F|nr:uncharacterized protein LOC130445514 [Diorhabda sublineata]XP_057653489.1 uncharacterized protein LOC130892244 [Diorhabda carinulata]